MNRTRFLNIMEILNRRADCFFDRYLNGGRGDRLWDQYNGFMRAANDFYNTWIHLCLEREETN